MNHNEEVPDFLGGLGDMLPANVLKMLNELLEQQHRKNKDHQGSTVFIYAPGSQYVERQINLTSPPTPLRMARGVDSAEASKSLAAGWIDANYQPLLSRTQAALLADAMAKKLEIKDKWKTFELLWNRRNMYRDYYDAMNQDQTYLFLDKLKELFR